MVYSLWPVHPPAASPGDAETTTRPLGSKISCPLAGNTSSHTSTPAAGRTTGTAVSSWNTATSTADGTRPTSQLPGSSKSAFGVHHFVVPRATPAAGRKQKIYHVTKIPDDNGPSLVTTAYLKTTGAPRPTRRSSALFFCPAKDTQLTRDLRAV